MELFIVRSKEFEEIAHVRFTRTAAENLAADINGLFGKYDERQSRDMYVQVTDVAEVANQKVCIDGDILGYQFSQTKHGSRVVTRTIRNLRDLDGVVRGEVTWNGREVTVEMVAAALLPWRTVEICGVQQ